MERGATLNTLSNFMRAKPFLSGYRESNNLENAVDTGKGGLLPRELSVRLKTTVLITV